MELTGRFKFIGMESKQGKNDATKTYYNASLLQGINPIKVGVQAEAITQFTGIGQMDEVEADLNVVVGSDYSYARITGIRKVTGK